MEADILDGHQQYYTVGFILLEYIDGIDLDKFETYFAFDMKDPLYETLMLDFFIKLIIPFIEL